MQKTTAATVAEVLGLPASTVHLDSDFQELGGSHLPRLLGDQCQHTCFIYNKVHDIYIYDRHIDGICTVSHQSCIALLNSDSLLMGRASTAIKKAFKLANFKGTAMYQLGTVRRIAAAVEAMLEQQAKEVVEESPIGRIGRGLYRAI